MSHYLPAAPRILDIGCGCGKTARFLALDRSIRSYVGFDVIESSVAWAEHYIAPVTQGRFVFRHCDVRSGEYNPNGRIAAADYAFPTDAGSIDVAFAASLFTHLTETDAIRYLAESARVLTAAGRLLLSLHTDATCDAPYVGDEGRVDVAPAHFIGLAQAAGLDLAEALGDICGQQVYVFARS